MHTLRPYQDKLIRDGAFKASLGHKRIILQAPTGSGKTVIFSSLIARYLSKNDKKVIVACHREKLVKQSRKALYDWYSLIAEPVFAETKKITDASIYVGMAETLYRRFTKNPNYIRNIGLLVLDEAHLGLFHKFIELHPEILVIGFTATPLSASKKKPLNGVYHEIVCGPQINDLIHERALTSNITHRVKDSIDRKSVRTTKGEYDQEQAGRMLSSAKHVNNTVEAFRKFGNASQFEEGYPMRAIVFNCNIEHSKIVAAAFCEAGYNARHIDGYMDSAIVEEAFNWLEHTPGAILCNVGIATAGIDIPNLELVLINKLTKSLPLYLQMGGRGSRLFPGKKNFIIIDMGKNYVEHGDWSDDRDWSDWFHNPDKPREGGVAPVKDCPECLALIHASVRVCPHCGTDVSSAPVYDDELVEFETVVQGKPLVIEIPQLVQHVAQSGRKEYAALHEIKVKIVAQARSDWGIRTLSDVKAYKLLEMYQEKVAEWCADRGKKYNQWHKDISTQWFFTELQRVFGWEPQKLEIAV